MKKLVFILLILLMSMPVTSVVLADVVPNQPELIFTAINNTISPAQTVIVTNTGAVTIDLTAVQIVGANPASYTLTNPPGGNITLLPGATTNFNITFNPPPGANGVHLPAILQIDSTDAVTPVVQVGLHGLSLQGLEGANEPGLQAVVDTLGVSINVGPGGLIIRPAPENIAPVADEITVELFEKAGPGVVSIVPVARFSPAELLPYGFYFPNGTLTPVLNEVNQIQTSVINPINHQTLNPLMTGAGTTFDPGTFNFGFYVTSLSFGRSSYTQNALNTGPRVRAARIFPVDDRNNNPVPNTFLLTYEDAANGDYQDYVFLISNVRIAANDAPVAADDASGTTNVAPIIINPLGNDTGVDAPLVATSLAIITPPNPAQGSVVNNGNGTVTFTPVAGFIGTSTFTYTVQDFFAQTSNTATVTVTVTDVTAPPIAPTTVASLPTTGQTTQNVQTQRGFNIVKRVDPAIAVAGDPVTFTITMSNNGTETYTNLSAEDNVPAEFEVLGATASAGSVAVNGQMVSFNIASLAPGASVTMTIQARIRAGVVAPILTNQVCAGANNLAATCTQATVLGVQALPSTGETPLWRTLVLWGGVLLSLIIAGATLFYRAQPTQET